MPQGMHMRDSMAEGFVSQETAAGAAAESGGGRAGSHSDIPPDRGLEATAFSDMASYAPPNPVGAPPIAGQGQRRTRAPWEGTGGGAIARATIRREEKQQALLKMAAKSVSRETSSLVDRMRDAALRLKGLRKAALAYDPSTTMALAPKPKAAPAFKKAAPSARDRAPDPGGLKPLRIGWLREGEHEGRRFGWRGGKDGKGRRRGYGERGRSGREGGDGWAKVSAALENGVKTVQVAMDKAEIDAPRAAALAKVLLKHKWTGYRRAERQAERHQHYYAPDHDATERYYAHEGLGSGVSPSQIKSATRELQENSASIHPNGHTW